MKPQPVTIAIVDDHAIMRKAVCFRLSTTGFKVVIEADNGKHFLDQLLKGPVPEICLLDINMPVMNGFETLSHLKKDYPDMKVVFFSMQDDKTYITKALQLGADGYVTKDAPLEELDSTLHGLVTEKRVKVAV
jgi:DNA-binding NarL/FixJ family response regulator